MPVKDEYGIVILDEEEHINYNNYWSEMDRLREQQWHLRKHATGNKLPLTPLSVQETVAHIISKQISVEEVIEHYLNRIKILNPYLNAIVSLKDEDKIKDEIKHLKQNNQETDKLLFGLPMAIKDLTDVAGLPTTFGLRKYKNNLPIKNSIMVDRLINHGAIIIGKTNTPELGLGSHTTNKLFGPTSNALDLTKTAGGSSGGAATAVAAYLVPFADGSDMMGSCRNPAAYSNIYGFRPTPGLIPEYRIMKIDKQFPLLSTPGCLARTSGDMALFLDAVCGEHTSDPFSFGVSDLLKYTESRKLDNLNINPSFRSFIDNRIYHPRFTVPEWSSYRKWNIGWLADMNGAYKFEEGIIDLCEKDLKYLSHISYGIIRVSNLKPDINASVLWDSWTTLRSKYIFDYLNEMKLEIDKDLGLPVRWEYEKGRDVKPADIDKALAQREECKKIVRKLFKKYDFLAIPSVQVFPFDKSLEYPDQIAGFSLDTYHRWMEVACLSSLLGLPTLSIPVGNHPSNNIWNKGGPMGEFGIGLQIIGRRGDDLKMIQFLREWEEQDFDGGVSDENSFLMGGQCLFFNESEALEFEKKHSHVENF